MKMKKPNHDWKSYYCFLSRSYIPEIETYLFFFVSYETKINVRNPGVLRFPWVSKNWYEKVRYRCFFMIIYEPSSWLTAYNLELDAEMSQGCFSKIDTLPYTHSIILC